MQRVILKRLQARLHLLLGQMKPKLENYRAFITEHFFQTFSTVDCLVQHGILEYTVHSALQHLAVPVAKEHAHTAFGRQLAPITPRWRVRQFLVGLRIKGAHFDQARVHPFAEQLDGFTLASPLNTVNQHDDCRALLLLQFVLRFEQGFAQRRHFVVVGFFVNEVTDFSGFEHGKLPGKSSQD